VAHYLKSNTEKLFTGSSLYELYRIAHNLEVEIERKDEGGVSKILKILKNLKISKNLGKSKKILKTIHNEFHRRPKNEFPD